MHARYRHTTRTFIRYISLTGVLTFLMSVPIFFMGVFTDVYLRRASLSGVHLSQACISPKHASLPVVHRSRACISHERASPRHTSLPRRTSLPGVHLSQARISPRRASLPQACISPEHARISPKRGIFHERARVSRACFSYGHACIS